MAEPIDQPLETPADPALPDPADPADPDPADPGDPELDPDADTFPRSYVEKLRTEAADHRKRATDAETVLETVRGELFTARVSSLDLLADPTDLPFDPALLEDPDQLRAAVDQLLEEKPHLRTRRIRDRAGQGEPPVAPPVSLAAILRGGA